MEQLTPQAQRVFAHEHHKVTYTFDLGWLFVVLFLSLLLYSVTFNACASSSAEQQILVFSYPAIGSLAVGCALALFEYCFHSLSSTTAGLTLGTVVQWVCVSTVCNFLSVVVGYFYPFGSLYNILVSLALIFVVFVVMGVAYFWRRGVRNRLSAEAHLAETLNAHGVPQSEEVVEKILESAEDEAYAQSGTVRLMGMPLVNHNNLFYRPSQPGNQYALISTGADA